MADDENSKFSVVLDEIKKELSGKVCNELIYKGIPIAAGVYMFYPIILGVWYYLPWIYILYEMYKKIHPNSLTFVYDKTTKIIKICKKKDQKER